MKSQFYAVARQEIFLPFFHNRNVEFKLDTLKGKIQIIAYVAKTVPETFRLFFSKSVNYWSDRGEI